ncbi:MAG: VIT domain-containing protein [Verrucomicrobiota bacterium]|nr:VIT domain-containing protein [Verrucomicrobiota bacterium]
MKIHSWLILAGWSLASPLLLSAAGTLTPAGSGAQPLEIRQHAVKVVINNGFAMTEVWQTFYNPSAQPVEGVYAFPLPPKSSLADVQAILGEKQLDGEVVERGKATQIYRDETAAGREAGLATSENYQRYEFRIAPIPAQSEVRLGFTYYEMLHDDTGVYRYLYPLEEGGTDEAAKSFWTVQDAVSGTVSLDIEVKSAWPVADMRIPGLPGQPTQDADGNFHYTTTAPSGKLDKDIVVYYRLKENLPGRIELLTQKADATKPGKFMLVLTPGLDLKPLTGGSDYLFILDTSGSMAGKLATLTDGVVRALGQLRPQDRFRVVQFNSNAAEVFPWTAASPENVQRATGIIRGLPSNGSTNLYDGLQLGLSSLDADRVASVILVTDGVTNTGIVEPKQFYQLLQKYDIRLFGFLLGNSSNWPIMEDLCAATGGYYASVSNADDILGQIILAKSKITTESMHGAKLILGGARTSRLTGKTNGKIYHGEQWIVFGDYQEAGELKVTLDAKLSGADKTYTATFALPVTDTDNPELDRLWAIRYINDLDQQKRLGLSDPKEADDAALQVALEYQIVMDQTAMLLLDDARFQQHGIDRKNQTRLAAERTAQATRAAAPVVAPRNDQQAPAFTQPAPSTHSSGGGGGGALDWRATALILTAVLALTLAKRHAMSKQPRTTPTE